jgi:hypothetical protein
MTTGMTNLYQDVTLRSGYLQLIRGAKDDVEDLSRIETAYFREVLCNVYNSLAEVLQGATLPYLNIYAPDHPMNAQAMNVDRRGLHAGLGFVSKLDTAMLALSAYLMENYLWQVSPPGVEIPPQANEHSGPDDRQLPLYLYSDRLSSITEVVGLDDFPEEALSLYATHLIPDAEARDGYQKHLFQLIMEFLQKTRLATDGSDDDRRTLARAFPKPLLDLVDFFERFDAGEAVGTYLDADKGPYLLKLHLQLLLDGLYFILAHEVAHDQLGHVRLPEATLAQLREEEAAADAASLALLRGIPGFQPRSLITIFDFARQYEPDSPSSRMDHPLARNRLLVLAETLLAKSGDDALRSDVNAGLALLSTRPEPHYFTFGWQGETPEDVDIFISSYADMDYTAHLMVYIDRAPRHARPEDAFKENAFLFAHLAYKIQFEVRDRIDPEKVYTWGGAGYHPTIRPEDLFNANRAETVFSRLHLSIPAPPEFCLKWPDAEFAVKKIELMVRAPELKSPQEKPNPVRFFYEPVDLELGSFLQSLPAVERDPALRSRLLLAARRYQDYSRADASIQIYQWLYRQNPESLPYGDLVDLAAQLIDSDRIAEAAEIARWALGPARVQRPRFHFILAWEHALREEVQEAYEEAFLEMALFGMYGDMFDDAQEMCAKIASYGADPVMGALRNFMAHRDAAGRAMERSDLTLSLSEFRAGRDALLAGQSQAHRDFVFLRQFISDLTLAISELEGNSFGAATEAAQAVLALRPDFVPALMNLARISLLQGDRKAANAFWQQAHTVAPFHSIVFDNRKEFEYQHALAQAGQQAKGD